MSSPLAPRPRWHAWATWSAVALLVAGLALYLVSPSGDCSADRDCGDGQRCVTYTTGREAGWQRLLRLHACVTPCTTNADCPAGRRCMQVTPGPQGPHCRANADEMY